MKSDQPLKQLNACERTAGSESGGVEGLVENYSKCPDSAWNKCRPYQNLFHRDWYWQGICGTLNLEESQYAECGT